MNKQEFFDKMDSPGNFQIPDCPDQEKWLTQWVRRQNRIEVMNKIFGAKGSRISKKISGFFFVALGCFFFFLAFRTGFIAYLLGALALIAVGWYVIESIYKKNGKVQSNDKH